MDISKGAKNLKIFDQVARDFSVLLESLGINWR